MNIDPNIDPIGGELQGCEGSFAGRAVGQPPHCSWLYQWIQWIQWLVQWCRRRIWSCRSPLTLRSMVSSWSSVLYVIHTIQLKRKGQDMWYQYTNIYINEYQWHGSIGMCFFGPRSQTLLARLRSTSINWSIPSNTRNTSITLLPFFVSFDDDCFDSVSADSNRSIAPTNMPLFHTLTGWEASQKGWWVNWQMRGYIPKCAAQHLLVAVCPFGECHFRGMT